MPNELEVELLKRMGWPEPTPIDPISQRAMMPRPATQYPKVERAISEVSKEYPILRTAKIGVWPFESPLTSSTIEGQTIQPFIPKHTDEDDPKISINPRKEAGKQDQIQSTIVHELQHLLQGRKGAMPDMFMKYEDRPTEKEAYAAQHEYEKKHDINMYDMGDSKLFKAIMDAHKGVVDIYNKKIRDVETTYGIGKKK